MIWQWSIIPIERTKNGQFLLSITAGLAESTRKMVGEPDINYAAFDYYGRLGKVKRFVDEHYADRLTLKTVADIACLEEKYFSNYFHTKTGVRFVDWIAWVRIGRAMDMLRQEDIPISVVSEATGFFDLRTFERTFKKYNAMTPTEFKKSVRPS